ncbi:syntenin-1 [Exaiptasia diaphana]|uniref:PDZ domain-containing protein n=1 Tax=Exaiptasia diaphana TaxID=2652724 RepID=A0A913WY99_EXADI|nr:syntenin-1 [Exaiptasia diaphana]
MSLYPSLEDMKVDQMAQAQAHQMRAQHQAVGYAPQPAMPGQPAMPAPGPSSSLYPSLSDYMGLDVSEEALRQHVPDYTGAVVPSGGNAVVPQTGSGAIAPVSGSNNLGIRRAEIKGGVREVIICKDNDGKLGLRVRAVNKGVFVAFVHNNSPASLGGLRFGDQILQIDGVNMAGYDTDKAMKVLKNASPQKVVFAIRDRPFERTIVLQKDSTGHVGFVFKDGKITKIAKDTSAARNGLLTEHHLVEVNGQNVVGLKDSEIKKILEGHDRTITLTIIPSFICEHIMKCMSTSLVKKSMDHSIPEV